MGLLPLPKETLSWCLTKGKLEFERLPKGHAQAREAVVQNEQRGGLATFLAAHLRTLARCKRMFIVSSGPLTRARWGRLLANQAIPPPALVPSLQYLLDHGGDDYAPPSDLYIAPSPGGGEMAYLPEVNREAWAIVGAFGSGHVVSGSHLTKAGVLDGLERFSAFHFGGHALGNAVRPAWSRLVLRPLADDVLARDIWKRDLSGLRVVTLSACSAADDPTGFGGGGLSLAAAFLRAGAGQVVAPLGDVDDGEALQPMERLYARLRHEDAVSALAALQRQGDANDMTRSLVVWTGLGALDGPSDPRGKHRREQK